MSVESEDFIADFTTRIVAHSQKPLVTRDIKKLLQVKSFPTVIIREGPDEVHTPLKKDSCGYDRRMYLSLIAVINGTKDEKAPAEMAAFLKEMKSLIYPDGNNGIGNYDAYFLEIKTSGIVPLKVGDHAIMQETILKVTYRELIDRTFT